MQDINLNKSHFVAGRRCPKALFLWSYSPKLKPPLTALETRTLSAGNETGEAARRVFPDGVLIETLHTAIALERTQQAIVDGALTLYEPAFRYQDVLIRVDILTRETIDSPWDLYEVKATTYNNCSKFQIQEYRTDVGIQVWVLQQLGIPLNRISLMHLNRECRHLNCDSLFAYEDYSKEIVSTREGIEADLQMLRAALSQPSAPKFPIGRHCEEPRTCPFKAHCWKDLPQPSIFNIPRNLKKWKLYEEGSVTVNSLSVSDFKSETHQRVVQCYQTERRYFDSNTVAGLLSLWEYPLVYLDFEAIDYPIPRFPGTRPYQHLPFQFSCHIRGTAGAKLEHSEFLWSFDNDPRPAFIDELLNKVPAEGSIVVYHKSYEATRLKELAEDFPESRKRLLGLRDRLVDLEVVINKGVYYPEFMGSFSIKKVAPAILGEEASYANLEIGDGLEAMLAYGRLISLSDGSEEKVALRTAMLEYCEQDTMLMVKLHHWLQDEVMGGHRLSIPS